MSRADQTNHRPLPGQAIWPQHGHMAILAGGTASPEFLHFTDFQDAERQGDRCQLETFRAQDTEGMSGRGGTEAFRFAIQTSVSES